MRAPITAPVGVLVEITLHVRRHQSSSCAHFLLECGPHELKQLGSHCSCSLSLIRVYLETPLSFSLRLSLSADLSVSSLSLCCFLCRLSFSVSSLCNSLGSLSRSQCVVLRRSISPSPSTLAQSTGFDHHDRVFGLSSPLRAPSPLCASSASFTSGDCKLQKLPAK